MNDIQKATIAAIVNIFETGRVRGDYGAIAMLKGDSGHLSYGRSQTTLGSGNLFKLLDQYCQAPNAQFSAQLKPLLTRFEQKDFSLDTDTAVRQVLQQAGRQDPVMRATQDQFFNEHYLAPACIAAESLKILSPLGQAVVYDSHIQGGWAKLQAKVGPSTARGEQDWITRYINVRKQWLLSLRPPLPSTVYRMDTFADLIAQKKWELPLPLTVRGVVITEQALAGDMPAIPAAKRVLNLTTPYLRGNDVRALQTALASKGLQIIPDGIYGPFTDVVVAQWKLQNKINEADVGSATRASLGL